MSPLSPTPASRNGDAFVLKSRRRSGFALVIALSLMGFMFLLILGLATMTQIELASTSNESDQNRARQNAYLGLMMAIGELKRIAGPDARVTARADILTGENGFDEDTMANPYWLGVWNSQLENWDTLNAAERASLAYWVVSGNENLNPTDADYLSPLASVGEDWVTIASASDEYEVPAVSVKMTDVVTDGVQSGGYAFWVTGDNSKALVSIADRNAASSDVDELNRSFQVSQRSAVEYVDGLDQFPVNDTSLPMVFDQSIRTPDWVSDGVSDIDSLRRARLHDLTTYSKGLLVDVKDGALKRDLTKAFEVDAAFSAMFSESVIGDDSAADPLTAEPYFFVNDPLIKSGGPNWGILRDYYQHYRPSSNGRDSNETIHLSAKEMNSEGREVDKYTPHRATHGYKPTSPRNSSLMPYESEYDPVSPGAGLDLYQESSWALPVISQIRISHALSTRTKNGHVVPALRLMPVISLYNPYNSKLRAPNLGMVWTLNPKITLTFPLTDEETGAITNESVAFYQAEVYQEDNRGRYSSRFKEENFQPGDTVHFAFIGNDEAVDRKKEEDGKIKDNNESNQLSQKWPAVGSIEFVLNNKDEDGNVKEFGGPPIANETGAISIEEAEEELSPGVLADYGVGAHPQWGLSREERDILDRALAQDAPTSISIDYEEFGELFFFFNAFNNDQVIQKIQDLWAPGSGDQPSSFASAYSSFTAATYQDSFETIAVALRTSDPLNGASPTDSIRNLIDANIRAIHSKIDWDGESGRSEYISLYYTGALGGNQAEPETFTDSNDRQLGFWGNSISSAEGQTNVILFERPRQPLLSLGQLQHANMSRYHFDPTYMVGNSYASLRIPLDDTRVEGFGDATGLKHFDFSYLVNERLWDGFFFSSLDIPAGETDREDIQALLASGGLGLDDVVKNPRMEFIPSSKTDGERYAEFVEVSEDEEERALTGYSTAAEMWVNGAFNVNSTSVEAWKAILASVSELRVPIYDPTGSSSIVTEKDALVSRFSRPYNRGYQREEEDSVSEFWKGYRRLNEEEIGWLAEAIVKQVKDRGPFLSLASFVNRKLENSELGKKGALQAALDSGVDGSNATNELTGLVEGEEVETFSQMTNLLSGNLSETDRTNMGFPGFVLQGDILQQIGPQLTVRSDTFTIRAYGQAVDPLTQQVVGRAWCEAKIQRIPEPDASSGADTTSMRELVKPSSDFGRKFKIVSFSWLSEDDI
ncbi:pilus assembly PilX family protein [Cerasicoccus fimbriatus]|uniref:pilus assembly PilX family protein n=1 Tax=Cerasicoccus fimbriatus TaxID=3014554 RepID=UPI0022B4F054|nr:hypothetical protein [Cerasicoccus sp. TK19100]